MTVLSLQRIIAAICTILAISALYFHAGEPLWNDEIYTLQFFVFKGIGTVFTDYHVPNNHILANAFHWLWLEVVGVSGLGTLLDHAWRIRLLPTMFSALTLWWIYRAGMSFGGRMGAWLSVLMLLSGVTFQAYSFQVRGYALSMTAATAMTAVLLLWASGKTPTRLHVLGLALASGALLLTLPSNLYLWAAALAGAGLVQLAGRKEVGKSAFLYVTGGLATGAVLAFLGYLPVMEQMRSSAYFETGEAFRGEHFQKLKLVLIHFFSYRWLLLPVLLAGAYFAWQEGAAARRSLICLFALLVLPFLFSAVRGDLPPERVFLPTLPVFALLLAFTAQKFVERVAPKMQVAAYAVLTLYAAVCYVWGVQEVRAFLRKNMDQTNHYYQGLNYNYYQHFYNPQAEYKLFRQKFGANQVLVLESTEDHDLPTYLRHENQAFVPLDSINSFLLRRQTMFVSTNYAKSFMGEMSKMGPNWRCRYLQNEARIPRVIVCEWVGK